MKNLKIKLHILLFVTLIPLHACSYQENLGIVCVENSGNNTKPLHVIPETIKQGETFKIFFAEKEYNHPENFLIRTPEEKSYIILEEGLENVISLNEFMQCNTLKIDTATLKGFLWNDKGEELFERVFKKSGSYTLYFADNLETEPSNTYSLSVDVRFINSEL